MTVNIANQESVPSNILTAEAASTILASTHVSMTAATKLFALYILNGHQGQRRGIHLIARELGLSVGAVSVIVGRLESVGAVSVDRTDTTPNGRRMSTRYTINIDRIRELANPPKIERVWPYEAPVNGEVPDSHYPHLGV
jgi:DNA-binding MarR family transcriptional regulator